MWKLFKLILRIVLVVALVAIGLTAYFSLKANKGDLSFSKYANSDKYSIGGSQVDYAKVKNLEIDWVSGSVTIETSGARSISFSEKASEGLDSEKSMRWWLDGDTLRIKFCKSGLKTVKMPSKDLFLTIPEGFNLDSVVINSVSAPVKGEFSDVSSLKIGTVSGNVSLKAGAVKDYRSDSVSGSMEISAKSVLSAKLDSVSGKETLVLPAGSGFEAKWSSVSGGFSSDFQGTIADKKLTVGNGKASYSFNTVSGAMAVKER